MRPAEFTTEAIIEAGQELKTAGRNITGFALRQKVGGGNPTRLRQIWDEHLASHSVTKAEPVADLPIEVAEEVTAVTKALTDRLANLAVELNDKAVKAAERRVAEVLRTAGDQREQAERELADAASTVEDLESKLDESAATIESTTVKVKDLQAANQTQAVELAQVRERLAATEHAAKTAAERHAADRARHQEEARQLRAEREAMALAQTKAATEFQEVKAELVKVQAKFEAADQSHQDHRKQAAAEAMHVTGRMNKAETERDEARKLAAVAREEAAKMAGMLESLQIQTASLTKALADRPTV